MQAQEHEEVGAALHPERLAEGGGGHRGVEEQRCEVVSGRRVGAGGLAGSCEKHGTHEGR